MAAAQLTDEEVYSELKRLGVITGPVTESTRPVYLKKLKKLREEQPQRGTRTGKTRSSGSINSSGGGGTAAGAVGLAARPASSDVTYLSPRGGRSPGGVPVQHDKRPGGGSKFVLGFSSDESDAEVGQKKGGLHHSGRRDRGSGHHHHHHHHQQQEQQQQQRRPPPTAPSPAAARRSHGVGVTGSLASTPSAPLEGRKSLSVASLWGGRGDVVRRRGAYGEEGEEDDFDEGETERGAGAVNGSRASYPPSGGKPAGDYSDSEEEESASGKERLRDRRLSPRRSQFKSPPSPQRGARGVEGGVTVVNDKLASGSLDMVRGRGAEEEEEELAKNRDRLETEEGTYGRGEPGLSGDLRYRGYAGPSGLFSGVMGASGVGGRSGSNPAAAAASNNHINSSSSSRFGIGTKTRYSSYNSVPAAGSPRSNHSNHTGPNHAFGSAAPEEELLQQFRREEVSATGGFSAHYLSMFLLTAACLFFLLLGLMYLRMRGSGAAEVEVVIKNHPFGTDFDNAYKDQEKAMILKILLHLHDHLAKIAGEHDCGDHIHHANRSLSINEASEVLILYNPQYEKNVSTALKWILKSEGDVGIRLIGSDPKDKVTDVSEIKYLESTHPNMSFICRFRRAFLTVIHRVVICIVGIGIVCGVFYYMKYRCRKEEEETRQMYDMVERIIDVLRSHNEAFQENKDLQPYLPIPHVRDSLILPVNRKKMKKVWERAVNFLMANESRIRTETRQIGGADFLVWRWTQPSTVCEKMSIIPSKVWQGKAFPLDRRNSPPNSLTPCLKIRNMFDPVMEVGENWDLAIHEAILEKCSNNDGIVHISVDKNSREGCVYVKCLSTEHAGKAFKALHGSWFDGKLVTVKYLRLDRYHQRFPQAVDCNTPLKPSSKHMKTMSHLRHRTNTGNSPGFS
nr:PREDICTED: inner nuclear membrane protein Man1 [Lepisosteus oculatus]